MGRLICLVVMMCMVMLSTAQLTHASADAARSTAQVHESLTSTDSDCCAHDSASHDGEAQPSACHDCPQCAVFHASASIGMLSGDIWAPDPDGLHTLPNVNEKHRAHAPAGAIDKPNWTATA